LSVPGGACGGFLVVRLPALGCIEHAQGAVPRLCRLRQGFVGLVCSGPAAAAVDGFQRQGVVCGLPLRDSLFMLGQLRGEGFDRGMGGGADRRLEKGVEHRSSPRVGAMAILPR